MRLDGLAKAIIPNANAARWRLFADVQAVPSQGYDSNGNGEDGHDGDDRPPWDGGAESIAIGINPFPKSLV
jgi:hypothetical protein